MKTTFELEDIQAIAEKMVDIMLPLLNQRQEQKDSILGIDEASGLLGKSKGQIYQWVSDSSHGLNDFPFLKAGKSLRFSKTGIIQWMQKHGKTR
jgi:predicted DNA-binding transcriptional regulator AlpA